MARMFLPYGLSTRCVRISDYRVLVYGIAHTMIFGNSFRASGISHGGLVWKMPYKLSQTRKTNVRKRLSMVEQNLKELNRSGVYIKELDKLNLIPRYSMLKPKDRYTYWARIIQNRKPVQFFPKFTKVDIPKKIHPGYEFDG